MADVRQLQQQKKNLEAFFMLLNEWSIAVNGITIKINKLAICHVRKEKRKCAT